MKTAIIKVAIICACILPMAGQAQVNLVRNPSMEQYSICPTEYDQISLANYWSSLDTVYNTDSSATYGLCAPEYCNTCATYYGVSIPNAQYYHHYPRTGNGMAQVRIFFDESIPSYLLRRDYLQAHLYKSLIAGQSYCVTYYTTLEDGSGYATNNVDAYLDDGSIDTFGYYCGMPLTEIIPQITDTSIIYDTLNWTKIQGRFIANGSERFITIGNFHDKTHTNYSIVTYPSGTGDQFTFYLKDDVSVIASNTTAYAGPDVTITQGDSAYIGVDSNGEGMPCYWYVLGGTSPIDSGGRILVKPADSTTYVVSMDLCGNITYDTVNVRVHVHNAGINNVQIQSVQIFPNPVLDELMITADNKITDVVISNLVGQIVYSHAYNADKVMVEVGGLLPGIYFVKVNNSIVRKFVKE